MRMVKLNAKAVQQVLNTKTRKPKAQWRVITRGMIVLNARGAHFRTKLVKMFAKHVEKIFKLIALIFTTTTTEQIAKHKVEEE